MSRFTLRTPFARRSLLGRLAAGFALVLSGGRWLAVRAESVDVVWVCTFNECDPYIYDSEVGDPENIMGSHPIPAGTSFEDLPDDWRCPICAAPKSYFIAKLRADV